MLWFLAYIVGGIALFGFKDFLKINFFAILGFYALLGLLAYSM